MKAKIKKNVSKIGTNISKTYLAENLKRAIIMKKSVQFYTTLDTSLENLQWMNSKKQKQK